MEDKPNSSCPYDICRMSRKCFVETYVADSDNIEELEVLGRVYVRCPFYTQVKPKIDGRIKELKAKTSNPSNQ